MKKLLILSAAAVALAASAAMAGVPAADGWVIGPIIKGRNYSPGMPLNPSDTREGLFQIELPQAPASVHYVTFRRGSLEGQRQIVLRYRLETARGVRVVATTAPSTHGIITPYFQRVGDNWTAVEKSSAASNPQGFHEAVRDTGEVGFVLGGGDGYGHGVHATGRARLIATDFRVE